MDYPDLMTVAEFCKRYSVGRTTAYRLAAKNAIKFRKLGTATRIARTDAEAWLASLPVRQGGAL